MIKDGLYAGYCGGIPIPRFWYWYSMAGCQKSSIPNTKPIPKVYMLFCNQEQGKQKQAGLSRATLKISSEFYSKFPLNSFGILHFKHFKKIIWSPKPKLTV